MSSTAAAAGAAFLAGLAWRDALICWAVLRWREDLPASREALACGYSRTVTDSWLTRLSWACAALVTAGASWLGSGWPVTSSVLALVCLVLAAGIEWLRARPTVRRIADRTGANLPDLIQRLLLDRLAITVLMAVAAGVAVREAASGTLSHVIAAAGAGFLAATLWNEVVVDRATGRHLSGEGQPRPSTSAEEGARATMLGYYAVMTVVATKPNLAAVFGAMTATFVTLAGQLAREASSTAIASMILFVVFGALASTRTWTAASVLGRNEMDPADHRETARMLGRTHLLFVVLLTAIIGLQVLVSA